ncbi:MAG: hypothetical protein FWC09_00105 [Lachnospiraceae bacterium]|nr:hypothetical protein [Lachnospiraceae bacterium]
MKKTITKIHHQLDVLLSMGDRESLVKMSGLLEQTWAVLLRKDDGLRYARMFKNIWMNEVVKGEQDIFNGVHSVNDILEKCRLVRHALFRLENDFPPDLCLEAIQIISDFGLSETAIREFLSGRIEDGDRVIARIKEITS